MNQCIEKEVYINSPSNIINISKINLGIYTILIILTVILNDFIFSGKSSSIRKLSFTPSLNNAFQKKGKHI